MSYQERLAIAGAIRRAPGGYTTRVSEVDPFIHVKGGRMTGWVKFTPEEARERFNLPEPESQEAA